MKKIITYYWVFLISSLLGFVIETFWCMLRYKKLEWRKSMIHEPLIPIYGVAGLVILLICTRLNIDSAFLIFLVGFIISTIVEFVSSIIQEKAFGTTSWNYTGYPLNIKGRVNVLYSALFGIAAVVLYKFFLYPIYSFIITLNINKPIILIFLLTLVIFLYDAFITCIVFIRSKERRENKIRNGNFWVYIDKKYGDDFIKSVYPNIKVI